MESRRSRKLASSKAATAAPAAVVEAPKMIYVVPTEFNKTTHDKMPSISPREPVDSKSDSKAEKANIKYFSAHPELPSLLVYLEGEILRHKPENIGNFLGELFDESNEANIKTALKLSVPSFET